jgi:hypothetical protein
MVAIDPIYAPGHSGDVRRADARLKLALAASAVAGIAAVCFALSQSPPAVARVNTAAHQSLGTTRQAIDACQPDEVIPAQTSAVRLGIGAFLGPRVTVQALAQEQVIARGERRSGWTGGTVTVPVNALSTARSGVEVCFAAHLNGDETAALAGERTPVALAANGPGGPLRGRVRIEYLRAGATSWWLLAPSVARRMGLGRAWSGTWSAVLVLALMAGVVALCVRLTRRALE